MSPAERHVVEALLELAAERWCAGQYEKVEHLIRAVANTVTPDDLVDLDDRGDREVPR